MSTAESQLSESAAESTESAAASSAAEVAAELRRFLCRICFGGISWCHL
jgi:hypothetical protein